MIFKIKLITYLMFLITFCMELNKVQCFCIHILVYLLLLLIVDESL